MLLLLIFHLWFFVNGQVEASKKYLKPVYKWRKLIEFMYTLVHTICAPGSGLDLRHMRE